MAPPVKRIRCLRPYGFDSIDADGSRDLRIPHDIKYPKAVLRRVCFAATEYGAEAEALLSAHILLHVYLRLTRRLDR